MPTRSVPSGRTTADGAICFPADGQHPVRCSVFGWRAFGWAATLMAALVGSGCVERTLMITSDPLGAHITVNGKDMGVTPLTIPFVHNQRFEYRIEKSGYRSVADEVTTPSTWDSAPGIDFFAENVYPGHIRRQTVHRVQLERLTMAPTRAELEAMFRQADAFRVRAETETGGPDIPAPTRADRLPPPAPDPAKSPAAKSTPSVTPRAPAKSLPPPTTRPPTPPSSAPSPAPSAPPQAGPPASR